MPKVADPGPGHAERERPAMAAPAGERRAMRRVCCGCPTWVWPLGPRPKRLAATLADLSGRGVGLLVTAPLPRGALLRVELPGVSQRLRDPVLARVARVVAAGTPPWLVGATLVLPLTESEVRAVAATARPAETGQAPSSTADLAPAAGPVADPFESGGATEQRSSFRRKGASIRVQVRALWGRRETIAGWVLDRSLGGLALHLPKPLPFRGSLLLRAENAPARVPRVEAEVRHCNRSGNGWLVGVGFKSTPPADVLLTFG